MKLILIAILAATCFTISTAHASDASASLLNADRALAAQSHTIGFVAAYSKAMAPDARKFDGGGLPAIGRDSIMALLAKYQPDLKLDWTPQEAVVAKSGELGFTWGNFVATVHDKKGQLTTTYGVYMDVWRCDSDGVWRWIADMGVGTPPPGTKSAEKPAGTSAADPVTSQSRSPTMAKVLGIGGIFFKSQDPGKLGEWYKQWLGVPFKAPYGASLPVAELPVNTKVAWAPFSMDTKYFAPSAQPFMFNLIVDDLDQALKQVEEGGGTLIGAPEEYPYGRFGRFLDPEGNKVELWQVPK